MLCISMKHSLLENDLRSEFFKITILLDCSTYITSAVLANEARTCVLGWRGLIIIMTYRFFHISQGKYIGFQLARREVEKQHRS